MTLERPPSALDVKLDNIRIQLTAIEDLLTDIRNELIACVARDGVAESVSCESCDAGADSIAAAINGGWTGIEFDPGGLSWNYLGVCPTCDAAQKAEEERLKPKPKSDTLF